MSRYKAAFRAKLKECQQEAEGAGESTNANVLICKVNARMREMNQHRGSNIFNSWNESRQKPKRPEISSGPRPKKSNARLDGAYDKARRQRKTGAARPSSAGGSGAAAAPKNATTDASASASTGASTGTSTATSTVMSAMAPASAKGDGAFVLSACAAASVVCVCGGGGRKASLGAEFCRFWA